MHSNRADVPDSLAWSGIVEYANLGAAALYRGLYAVASIVGTLFPIRTSGVRAIPRHGGVLILANHTSYMDPPLVGLTMGRSTSYVARSNLFGWTPFRWLITSLNAIPIDQDGFARQGLRETIRRLEAGKAVVLFPEGTRTRDGRLAPLRPGVLLLLRRTNVPVVLAGISGAFESMPMQRHWPIPVPIWVHFRPWRSRSPRGSEESLVELASELRNTVSESARRVDQLRQIAWTQYAFGSCFQNAAGTSENRLSAVDKEARLN